MSPMAIPDTGALIGTPASIKAKVLAQVAAIEVERARVVELETEQAGFMMAIENSCEAVARIEAQRDQLAVLLQDAVKESDAFDRGERVMGEWVPRAKELLAIPENGDP